MSDWIRGTTQDFSLEFEGLDMSQIAAIEITLAQFKKEVLTKTFEDVTIEGQSVNVHLSQEDTLKLREYSRVNLQVRVLMADGNAYATEIMSTSVAALLKGGVIE